jgi:hypothetical protein
MSFEGAIKPFHLWFGELVLEGSTGALSLWSPSLGLMLVKQLPAQPGKEENVNGNGQKFVRN